MHGVVLRTGKALRSHSLLHALAQRVQICIAAHLGGQAGLACLLNIGNRLVAFSQQASAFSIDFLQVGARVFGFMARALQGLVFLAASLLHGLTAQGGEVLFRRVHLHDQRQTLGFQILNLAVHGGGNGVRAAACQLLIQDILHARQAQHMRYSLTLHLRQRPQGAERALEGLHGVFHLMSGRPSGQHRARRLNAPGAHLLIHRFNQRVMRALLRALATRHSLIKRHAVQAGIGFLRGRGNLLAAFSLQKAGALRGLFFPARPVIQPLRPIREGDGVNAVAVGRKLARAFLIQGGSAADGAINAAAAAQIAQRRGGLGDALLIPLLSRNHFIYQLRRHSLYRVGINDKLVVFTAGGSVVFIIADFNRFGWNVFQIQHAQITQAAHAILKSMLLVFIRHDAQVTIVRQGVDILLGQRALARQQGANAKIRTLNIVLFYKGQNYFT